MEEKNGLVDIEGYEGLYSVNEKGQIWSYYSKRYLKPQIDNNGYLRICLRKNGKNYMESVQRIVAKTFVPNPDNKPLVSHKNEDKEDVSASNLYWSDYQETALKRSEKDKATKERFKKVKCVETQKIYDSAGDAAMELNCSESCIRKACGCEQRMSNGYHWIYVDGEGNKITAKKIRPIRCVETQKVYDTIIEGSKDTGANETSINAVLKGSRVTAGGLHWEYAD